MTTYTLAQLANSIDAELKGDAQCEVHAVAPLASAKSGQISFLANNLYLKHLATTQASAVLLAPKYSAHFSGNSLVVKNPELSMVTLLKLFYPQPTKPQGVHPTAVIGGNCKIDSSATIGPYCVIEDNVTIQANTVLETGVILGCNVQIGADCHIYSGVTIYHSVKIGNRVILHSGVVIGSDGFGLVKDQENWVKIPQIGGVVIGNDVEIGANTTIDRGALQDTIIGNGVKIDNLVQIGHNVKIGDHTAIAGCVGIAGSTEIGRHCMLGGAACITGHVQLTDGVVITGFGSVGSSIKEPGIYSSGVNVSSYKEWRRNTVRFSQLDDMAKRLKKLEKFCYEQDEH